MAVPKKRSAAKTFYRAIEGSKLDIWRAYVAAGGRVGEVAAQFQISPAEVEKIVSEVEDFFHAPLNDPEKLLNQLSMLNEAANRAEFMLYEVVEFYYNRWKNTGEEPPRMLVDVIEKWHSLVMERINTQLKVLQSLQKQASLIAQQEEEKRFLEQLLSDTEEVDEE